VNVLRHWGRKPKPKPTEAEKTQIRDRRSAATDRLGDAERAFKDWAGAVDGWPEFAAEKTQAAQFADEVADVLRRHVGFVDGLPRGKDPAAPDAAG
jgi:hypothetical protein